MALIYGGLIMPCELVKSGWLNQSFCNGSPNPCLPIYIDIIYNCILNLSNAQHHRSQAIACICEVTTLSTSVYGEGYCMVRVHNKCTWLFTKVFIFFITPNYICFLLWCHILPHTVHMPTLTKKNPMRCVTLNTYIEIRIYSLFHLCSKRNC